MKLLPIQQTLEENEAFKNHPNCQDSLGMTIDFFNKIGYNPPFIGYYAEENGQLVGSCAVFKKYAEEHKVEVAYGTFLQFQQQGNATEMCRQLVVLALTADPTLKIIAHTLAEENYSTKVLRKNGFEWHHALFDEEDGDIWEWVYVK